MPSNGSQDDVAGGPAGTHKIVDGDTLADLAARYLGEADRYLEIYEANRDLLPSPEVLPIGAELQIPRARGVAPAFPSAMPRQSLVPVAPAQPRRGHGFPQEAR